MLDIHRELTKYISLDGKGCLLLDFGMYFPYKDNQDMVVFDVVLLEQVITGEMKYIFGESDIKLNHRYPNKGYVTISKKYGRKVCSLGYPIVEDIELLNKMKYIMLKVGYKKQFFTIFIPIKVSLSSDNPYAYITVHIDARDLLDKEGIINIDVYTFKEMFDNSYTVNHYTTKTDKQDAIYLQPYPKPIDTLTMKYETIVSVKGVSWENAKHPF